MDLYKKQMNEEINSHNKANDLGYKVILFKGKIVKDEKADTVTVMNVLTFTAI